jgi:hypothetical protein
VDRMQEITGARTLVAELGWSKASVAKSLGEEDWEGMQREKIDETLTEMHVRNMQMQKEGEIQLKLQMAGQAAQMQMQMAMQQGPQGAPQGQQGPPPTGTNLPPQGMSNQPGMQPPGPGTPQGPETGVPPGMNPAEGEPPPVMANPGGTGFEARRGRPRKTQ